jgi:hypothetical protein
MNFPLILARNNSPNFMSTGMNNMNNFMGPPSGLDGSGFNSLHYAAAAGLCHLLSN